LQAQFHTPSFGDEEFDIPGVMAHHHAHPHAPHPPPHHQLDQYQMHSQMGLMNDQQAYSQHQWHPQSAPESHPMMTNQTYHNLHSPTNHSTYHHLSSPNQMLMMQPPSHQAPPAPPTSGAANNQHQPQMSPQMSGNNYIGQSPPQTAPINSNENGSTSDESDDNALNDPNVSL
jgi:hypothetical protein